MEGLLRRAGDLGWHLLQLDNLTMIVVQHRAMMGEVVAGLPRSSSRDSRRDPHLVFVFPGQRDSLSLCFPWSERLP